MAKYQIADINTVELRDTDKSILITKNGIVVAVLNVDRPNIMSDWITNERYESVSLIGHGVTVRFNENDRYLGSVASSMAIPVREASIDGVLEALA